MGLLANEYKIDQEGIKQSPRSGKGTVGFSVMIPIY